MLSEPASQPRTILVVEDDDDTRSAMLELLRAEGYHVLEAGSGAEASYQLKVARPSPELVFLDSLLPDMSGQQWLANSARILAPFLRVCLVTGDAVQVSDMPASAQVVARLTKPFEPEELLAVAGATMPREPAPEDSGVHKQFRPSQETRRGLPRHRRFASGARRLSMLLAQASEVLASSLDVEGPIRETLGLIVPSLADWCVLDCPRHEETPPTDELQLAVHADLERAPRLLAALRQVGSRGIVRLVGGVLHDGQPLVLSDLATRSTPELWHDNGHAELLKEVGLNALLIAPLATRGHVFGSLTLGLCSPLRAFAPSHVETAVDLAHRIALTVDNGRLYQRMQRAVRAREELLAMVSHDLRTPLCAITTSVATLQRLPGPTSPHSRAITEAIRRNARRMESMIRDLLDFSQLESGRLRVELKRQPLGELARGAIEAARPLAVAHDLRLTVDSDSVWLSAACDRDRVLQILGNLLDNALKFTPKRGRITMRLWRSENEAIISVSDTGRGISAQDLPHVFEAYRQGLDSDTNRARRSVGLGLYIARGLAEAHRGQLWAESTPNQGSTFHFSLPL